MIGKVVATTGALIPVAAAAAHSVAPNALADAPTVWSALGYHFEAAGMLAALFGCASTRFWIGAGQHVRRQYRWELDVPVSAIALALSAALIVNYRPVPFAGLMIGIGCGMLGEGIFKIAERQLAAAVPALAVDEPPAPPHP